MTAVKRQISKKTGKEYARLTLEDFHGTAEAIVFPDAWAKLNQVITRGRAPCCSAAATAPGTGARTGPRSSSSRRRPLAELRASGAAGHQPPVARRRDAPPPDAVQAAAALCAAHPGPAPVYIEWSDGNGEALRLRARRLRVAPDEDLLRALRDLLGAGAVHYVKAG